MKISRRPVAWDWSSEGIRSQPAVDLGVHTLWPYPCWLNLRRTLPTACPCSWPPLPNPSVSNVPSEGNELRADGPNKGRPGHRRCRPDIRLSSSPYLQMQKYPKTGIHLPGTQCIVRANLVSPATPRGGVAGGEGAHNRAVPFSLPVAALGFACINITRPPGRVCDGSAHSRGSEAGRRPLKIGGSRLPAIEGLQ